MTRTRDDFSRSVFVNCPFDSAYLELLRPLLFTIVAVGYIPRIASERSDSGENRVEKISALIAGCRYSIHDLSRLRASEIGEFYRMNMPFELGIEYGSRRFGTGRFKTKRCLVLERDAHEFQKAISDLAGIDIKRHNDQPADIVRATRDWFVETVGLRKIPSATHIWRRFTEFASDFYDDRVADGFSDDDLNMMPVPEYLDFIQAWWRR